ncbi:MAG: hypothetical protein ISS16_11065 [Ignavibacteria bacterium]|nr:hypothetical protein [Ignavibacteria bacterium]
MIRLHQPPISNLNASHLWKANLTNTSGKDIKMYHEGFVEEKNGIFEKVRV